MPYPTNADALVSDNPAYRHEAVSAGQQSGSFAQNFGETALNIAATGFDAALGRPGEDNRLSAGVLNCKGR